MRLRAIKYIILLAVLTSNLATARTLSTKKVMQDYAKRENVECMKAKLMEMGSIEATNEERDALRFLYTYMQLPDIADYPVSFYLANIRTTYQALNEMPWGKNIPDRELKHFILPVRVNNEFLDTARQVFYKELKERVKGLSMEDAILEVNHWCHEKVTYRPSDARTTSPLATMRNALGRCGEESTFTVAALRAIGIPARQVYTPRWAHTDDNHAWVEAWANGKWYFLGACEPEAVLNLGWFNAPASRGMMMNTKVFGNYDGPEEVITRNPTYTTINVTSNYAPTANIKVKVVDSNGKAIEGADVDFGIYNYAEFYTITTKKSDAKGRASLTTGLGDILVWASKDGKFGWSKATGGEKKTVTVRIDKDNKYLGATDINIIPPKGGGLIPNVTPEQMQINNSRKEYEDSLRNAYTSSFIPMAEAKALAASLNIDEAKTWNVLQKSRGNYATITSFLRSMPNPAIALKLLTSLTDKDLSDVRYDVLVDAMMTGDDTTADIVNHVLNPRVDYENLTTFKSYFNKTIPEDLKGRWMAEPSLLVQWIADSIVCNDDYDPQHILMNPESVYELRWADAKSRDICFVKIARALGIKAKINPIDGSVLYYDNKTDKWIQVDFNKSEQVVTAARGGVHFDFKAHEYLANPQYYTHFSLSKIVDGKRQLLEYPEDATYNNTFNSRVSLDEGQYVLTTGQRLASGEVLSRMYLFNVVGGKTSSIPLVIRNDESEISVIGQFNSENIYYDMSTGEDKSILSTTGRGYYVLGIINANHEPSSHLLNEISALKDEFEAYGKPIILLFADESEAVRFDAKRFPDLPSNIRFGIDLSKVITNEILENMNVKNEEKPILIIADTFNRIVSFSQGYTIGSANRILETLNRVNK